MFAIDKTVYNVLTYVTSQIVQMFSPIMRSQENDIVSVNKTIIETCVVAKQY